jgi:type I restriction enzyme S subunit
MNSHILPKGWIEKSLKELCGKPQYGYTASANVMPVGPKFLRITDIQNGNVDWETVPFCSCSQVEKYRLRDGDILFARTGATTGKSFLVKRPPESIFASYLIRITPGREVIPEFLYLYFQSSSYWWDVSAGIDDGNRPNMNGSKLGELQIPFPKSKDLQRRFVARIEELTRRAEEVRRLSVVREKDLDVLLQSAYGRLIADVEWKPLSKVASIVRRGISVKPEGKYEEMGTRSFGKGTFKKPVLTGKEIGNKRIYRIHEGDLVFNNVFAWEGAIAVAQEEDHGRAGSHRFITYAPHDGVSTAEFLCHHFLSERGIEDIRAASPGSAGRNRTLGLKKLEQIDVPVPDYHEQKRFAEMAKRRRAIRRECATIEKELKIFQSALLAKAFRGEL